MKGLPNVAGTVGRIVATAQNGLEVIRMGGLDTGTEPTPYKVVETEKMYRLRRYFPDDAGDGFAHIILIPPMMVSANVYDVTQENGAVSVLYRHKVIPWVVDFGSPDHEEGGMERTLTDHVVAISRVIDLVRRVVGQDVHLGGYSQGGMFAYQTAAYRRSEGLASVVTFGSPVDVLAALPLGLPAQLVVPGAEFVADNVFNRLWIPSWLARTGFQLADPVKTARSRIDFLRKLHDRDALLPREDQRRFIEQEGWVAWSGPAVAELLRQFVVHNRMMSGGFVIDGEVVSMTEITCPVLAFVGETDDIGQPLAVRGIVRAAPDAEVYETAAPVGHFGLVVGSNAGRLTWPTVGEWIQWREGNGEQPAAVTPMSRTRSESGSGISWSNRLTYGVGQVAGAGTAVSKELLEAVNSLQRTTRAVATESVRTVPRLFRLGQIQPSTRVSLGKLMSENAKRTPHDEVFLFEDRVLTHTQVNARIDNVVAGLIECGIRPGVHVGLMMDPRPSALVTIAALSRLGAVAVLLSSSDALPEMLTLAETRIIVSDPVHLDRAAAVCDRVLVLGGGSSDARAIERADGEHIVDMEKIDPERVRMPVWYRPDPGLAGDLAFILFTETQGRLNRWSVTNHRFAMSAFGAAAAAGLSNRDTVYCLPPLHHASGLLTTLGATAAGRSRIALSTGIDPERFTREVRRYGVTVVSYTWNMLADIVDAPEFDPGQLGSVRLFMGSGLSAGVWTRLRETLPNARVLEFFATADGSAILANVDDSKIGAMGRALPETNPVRVAAYDPVAERMEIDRDTGFVREAGPGEVGMLVAHAGQRFEAAGLVLRDVFRPHDRWEVGGSLFQSDADGDLWYMGSAQAVIRSRSGPIYPVPIQHALSLIPDIKLAAVYAVGEPGEQLAVAAVTLRGGATSLTPTQIRVGLGELPAAERPHLVWVADSIPLSESFRAMTSRIAARGLPKPGPRVWYRDQDGRYRRYTASAAATIDWTALPAGDDGGAE
ncbi:MULTISPECIES: AMP-binding protein [Gordonia]|uniref:Acyl-CoA synthetase n=2 Tax=Gordonia TaxID=2053 RepID=A0ABN3HPB0_9ACTN|nr:MULTISPECIES: AMP-binding protein [Gordonia]AUH68879.1 acyl-CoA synthetase [Gordonia sp. YC-JH1]KJR06752.1 acyl-CoA synthetase [Gordonia sihwensis]KXT56329.1 acyl-CoA synthetase [Gordonia sp. QH-12]MBY4570624.1 acyl-CoA synthetase [Gordonia sihwensis]GAC60143.1 putative fatty-acid--CoA ligase [Gordonia sihwensis NBRC 108236]